MSIKEQRVVDFMKSIQDENSEYYGGVVAYHQLALNLSLFIKLMKKKRLNTKDDKYTYDVMILLAETLYNDSIEFAEEDGTVFSRISSKQCDDNYIDSILKKQYAFILNLNGLKEYVAVLIQTSKGSIVEDYKMISQAISSTKENVLGIIKYEQKKFQSEDLRIEYSFKYSML